MSGPAVSKLGTPPPPSPVAAPETRSLPTLAFILGCAVSNAVGFYGGYIGSLAVGDTLYKSQWLPVGIGATGLVIGAVVGLAQTILVFRATGRGMLWAVGTAAGGALGTTLFITKLFGLVDSRTGQMLTVLLMGASVGLGQWLTVRRWRLLPHVAVCGITTLGWFGITESRGAWMGPAELGTFLEVVAPSVVSGALAAVGLWLCVLWDRAKS